MWVRGYIQKCEECMCISPRYLCWLIEPQGVVGSHDSLHSLHDRMLMGPILCGSATEVTGARVQAAIVHVMPIGQCSIAPYSFINAP